MSNADNLRDANPWHPMTHSIDLAHLGKLAEEINEAVAAVCSCVAEGVSEVNAAELENEIVDVDATISLVIRHFRLAFDIPWQLKQSMSDAVLLALLGKHLGIAGAAVSRCIIQGIDECEPVTGKLNRQWLEESLGGVLSALPRILAMLNRDDIVTRARMGRRREKKTAHLQQWHSMLEVEQ